MRAAIWHGPDQAQTVEQVELRNLGRDEVKVRIHAANACVTDVIDSKPRAWPAKAPQIRGHGAVGIVEAAGDRVRIAKEGDKVILSATSYCGKCHYCMANNPSQCAEIAARVQDPRGYLADGREVFADANIGGFAERTIVSDIQIVPIDSQLPDDELALLSIAGAAGVGAALITAPVERGSWAAVVGCGVTGLSYILGAKIAGAERIIAVDPLAHRRDFALRIGATDAVDPALGPVEEQIRALTPDVGGFQGWGVDYCYEASANPQGASLAYAITRSGGHVVLASVPWDFGANVSLPAMWLGAGGKTIHSSQHGGIHILRDFPRFVHFMEDGALDMAALITDHYRLEDINRCFDDMEAYRTIGAIVVP